MKSGHLYKILSVVMILSTLLMACGGGGAAPTAAPSGGTQPTTAPAVQPTTAPAAQPTTAPTTASSGGAATTAPTTASGGGASGTAFGGITCPDTAKGQAVKMFSPLTGPDGTTLTQIADKFNSGNPWGIKVTHVPQPDYMQALNAGAAAKNLPEMTVIRAINIGEMAARNVLQPLDAQMNIIGDIKSDFPAQFWSAGDYKGKHYAIPLDAQALVLYYNKDMFKAAGLTAPAIDKPMTKDEFEKDIAALNKNGVEGISIGSGFQAATLFQTFIRQFGGAVAPEDGSKATFNSDAGVKALQYVQDLKKKYSPEISGAGDPEVKVFQQGKSAMTIHGPWHISDMEKLGFVGYAPMPQVGDNYFVWGGGHQLAITTTDPAKAAATACWIGWLSKNSADWAKAGNVPIRNSVRNSGQLTQISPPVGAYASSADKVILLTAVPAEEGALWDQFGAAIDAVLLGQQSDVKKALDDAAAKSDKTLADNKAKYQ